MTGIELSQFLLAIAENNPHRSKPTYIHDDARSLLTLPDKVFDGAACIMALMDIDDIKAAFGSISRVSKPGAWLVVVLTHPCFESPRARTDVSKGELACVTTQYLTEGSWRETESGVRSRFGAQHRTISTYLNTVIDARWDLERVEEPRLADRNHATSDHPGLLMLKFRR